MHQYDSHSSRSGHSIRKDYAPMALSLGVGVAEVGRGLFSSLSVMVDVEGVREKVLVRGPRWVSLSSVQET